MKKIIGFLFFLLFLVIISKANNIQISNVSVVNNGPGNIQIKFDVSWDNSWRVNTGPNNYDGAWVFFKYKTATGNWTHLTLTGSNNVISSGFDIYQPTTFTKTGVMVYRAASNMGTGSVNVTNVLVGAISTLPYDIDVKGFAVEMVYVPAPTARPFFGDGDGFNESQAAFHYTNNTATNASVVPMTSDGNGFDDSKLVTDGIYIYSNDTIQTSNPIGSLDPFPTMKSFWCMKYELSQAGYRDFLNTLTLLQQTNRTANSPTSAAGTGALVTANQYRNAILIKTPSTGGNPAVYGCDGNSNGTYDEAADGEWVSCAYLNWPDVAAYLDWSGLAPMSELQFEFMCRGVSSSGPNTASYGELAWGNNLACSNVYLLSNASTASETITNPCVPPNGNLLDNPTYQGITSMMRNGIFAVSGGSRISSGASYYGIMELSGNASEYAITVGNVAGRSTRFIPNGNGNLSTAGYAQLSVGGAGFWPGMEGNSTTSTVNTCSSACEVTGYAGIMTRGGNWAISALGCAIAYRAGTISSNIRNYPNGCRGILYLFR